MERDWVAPVAVAPRSRVVVVGLVITLALCVTGGGVAFYYYTRPKSDGRLPRGQAAGTDNGLPPVAGTLGTRRGAPPLADGGKTDQPGAMVLRGAGPGLVVGDASALSQALLLGRGRPEEADPLIPRDAFGFVSVPVAAWWNGEVGRQLPARTRAAIGRIQLVPSGLTVREVERAIWVFPSADLSLCWTIFVTVNPYNAAELLQRQTRPNSPASSLHRNAKIIYRLPNGAAYCFHNDRVLVAGTHTSISQFVDSTPGAPGDAPWSDVLRSRGKDRLVAFAQRTPAAVKDLEAALSAQWKTLLRDVRSVSVSAELGNTLQVDLSLRCEGEASAARLSAAVPTAQAAVRLLLRQYKTAQVAQGFAESRKGIELLEKAVARLAVAQSGTDLHGELRAEGGTAALAQGLLLPAFERWRQDRIREATTARLARLAQAMFDYQHVYRRLPPATFIKGGRPLYSWRVELLPFLDRLDLYRAFHKDEPWDSPHNIALLAQMPDVYAPVGPELPVSAGMSGDSRGQTPFQVFVGPDAPFDQGRRPHTDEFSDGAGKTILIVEARELVPWTKPADVPFRRDGPAPRLGGRLPGGFQAALANGRVRLFPYSLAGPTLRAWVTPSGGEDVE